MSTKSSTLPPPVRFYDPTLLGRDSKGRTLLEILSWNDRKLESCHDYIQTLFPLPEPSPYNYAAPVIDREVFDAFRSRPELRAQFRKSLDRMLQFFGFELYNSPECDDEQIIIADPKTFHNQKWITRFDHNHLRITRILRSLRVLGLEKEADAFFKMLYWMCQALKCEGPEECVISDTSLKFWTRAAKRPLFLAPEDEGDEGRGRGFLYELERGRGVKMGKTGGGKMEGGKGEGVGDEGFLGG